MLSSPPTVYLAQLLLRCGLWSLKDFEGTTTLRLLTSEDEPCHVDWTLGDDTG